MRSSSLGALVTSYVPRRIAILSHKHPGTSPWAVRYTRGLHGEISTKKRIAVVTARLYGDGVPLCANIREAVLVVLINERGENEKCRDEREFSWCCSFPWGFGCLASEPQLTVTTDTTERPAVRKWELVRGTLRPWKLLSKTRRFLGGRPCFGERGCLYKRCLTIWKVGRGWKTF